MEVGVGITAGCMATLRPLLKATLGSTGENSGHPWSKTLGSKFGDNRSGQQLDMLRQGTGKQQTTTTVTGGRASSESDEEKFLATSVPSDPWNSGIKKSVTTTITAELAASQLAAERTDQEISRVRCSSAGGDSQSTLGGDMTIKVPTKVFERV